MNFIILEKGKFIFDGFHDNHTINEVDYEILKDKMAEKYYIRGWHNGNSALSEIPLELYTGLDMYLESELLVIREELEKCL